jgi:ATP-dependent RNA helicase RhlE
MSQQSFRELGASRPVVDALAARSIHQPFRIQVLVLPDALAGLDVLAKSPTGSGKTLAFAVPIVERTTTNDPRPSALVLVPTRELASQVTEDIEPLAKAKGLSVASVYGGKPMGAQAKRAKKAHVLVATPGRLQDLADRRMVDLSGIRILVLDEADRMLDMGFQPQVDKIVKRLPRNRQTMFFSATLDGRVGELASAYTNSPSRIEGELSSAQPAEIEHQFVSVTNDTKVETLVEHIRASESTLVFVRTKRGADRLVQKLAGHVFTAAAMHADK